jgi:uncharacterized protein
MKAVGTDLDTLERRLDAFTEGGVAVAVSGGVDSMTLAVVAHRRLGERAEMFHAVSPAVPAEATARVRDYAQREGWRLRVLDAGEFEDHDYLSNPRDRCYFCKSHLYGTIAAHARPGGTIVAGTNTDDLGDYRPGLRAADEHAVAHPYLEAGISKAAVRALAHGLGLDDLAELPAAPCLASRIETGIAIRPRQLALVHQVEQAGAALLTPAPAAVRCRIRADGVVVELDQGSLDRLTPAARSQLESQAAAIVDEPVTLAPYRTGSAVL